MSVRTLGKCSLFICLVVPLCTERLALILMSINTPSQSYISRLAGCLSTVIWLIQLIGTLYKDHNIKKDTLFKDQAPQKP